MLNGGTESVWVETATLSGSQTPVRVVLNGREGGQVFVRQLDLAEPEPERVSLHPGEELVVMQAISHTGLHATADQTSDMLLGMRVLPVRRQGSVVYARSLRHGEEDTGQRVHVRPGGSIEIEEGARPRDRLRP